jgi:hypothetical protein
MAGLVPAIFLQGAAGMTGSGREGREPLLVWHGS